MKFNEIMKEIKLLSYSQGSYGRLYREIMASPYIDDIAEELERQNFTSALDMILYFEC